MPLTIAEVVAKVDAQTDPLIGVVQDGEIYYLVLNNKKDWKFTDVSIRQIGSLID